MLLRGILLYTVRILKQISILICFHGQILKVREMVMLKKKKISWLYTHLEEISSLSYSIVFRYFFALIAEKGFLISLFGTLHSNGNIFPFLLCFSLLFFSQIFVRPPQKTILPFCISFPWGWSWSLSPVQCLKPPSIVHQALCLSDLVPWIYFSLPLYKGFDVGHTWMV